MRNALPNRNVLRGKKLINIVSLFGRSALLNSLSIPLDSRAVRRPAVVFNWRNYKFCETEFPVSLCHNGAEIRALASLILRRAENRALRLFAPGRSRGCSVSAVFRVGEEISFELRNNTVSPDTGPLGVSVCGFCNASSRSSSLPRNPLDFPPTDIF